MQTLNTDIQSLGGSGGFGGGFGGNDSLLWLLLLLQNGGLGGNKDAAAGFVAGENTSKLDCLSQGQNSLAEQLRQQSANDRFAGLSGQISELAGISRDGQAANTAQNNSILTELLKCCCANEKGQQEIKTAIAAQTCDINQNTNAGVQRLVDLINNNTVEAKNTRISELEQAAQTATLAAIINDACGKGKQGNSFDISSLAALMGKKPE